MTRDRLRKGGSYCSGDIMAWFDENGRQRYLRVDAVHDDKTLDVTIGRPDFYHPNFKSAVSDTQLSELSDDKSENRHLSMPVVDKFCRGSRADLGILLTQINREISQMTVSIPPEVVRALQSVAETVDWSKVSQTVGQTPGEALQEGIKSFYYQNPPNYQQLFDAIRSILQSTNERIYQCTGIKFDKIQSQNDVIRLLEQGYGIKNIPQIDTIMGSKYTGRLDVCCRAALALFQCWLKESPHTWQSQRAINE